jgi:AcrR family transcriptional regulator
LEGSFHFRYPRAVPDTARPLRRDAERNRQLVLATARELVAERGLDVTHEDIARAAGVGMGTVYRRFPERQDLFNALFDAHIDAVVALAEDAREAADAWEGLQGFMERTLEMQAQDRGLSELLRGSSQDTQLARRARTRISPVVAELVERAQAAGQLAPGVAPGDFVLAQIMVTGVLERSRSSDLDLWRRALAMVLAGLRAQPVLPGSAPDAEAIDRLQQGTAKARTRRGAPRRA